MCDPDNPSGKSAHEPNREQGAAREQRSMKTDVSSGRATWLLKYYTPHTGRWPDTEHLSRRHGSRHNSAHSSNRSTAGLYAPVVLSTLVAGGAVSALRPPPMTHARRAAVSARRVSSLLAAGGSSPPRAPPSCVDRRAVTANIRPVTRHVFHASRLSDVRRWAEEC